MFSQATVGLHCEPGSKVDWHGVLQWSALSGAGAARTRAWRAIDAGAIREALRADEQERLSGCRSYCRSGATTENAICADQDRGTAGSASATSRARALGDATHGGGEPDSQSSSGTWTDPAQGPKSSGSAIASYPGRR